MNHKRIFGAVLTVFGIGSLIYAVVQFANSSNNDQSVKSVIIFGILGVLFFFSGIGLINKTKDEA